MSVRKTLVGDKVFYRHVPIDMRIMPSAQCAAPSGINVKKAIL